MDEYLLSKQIGDIKDAITELVDVHHIPKPVAAGHFLLYCYNKKPAEFRQISSLLVTLAKEDVLSVTELEESYFIFCHWID